MNDFIWQQSLISFIFAIIEGGTLGESIDLFLYKQHYPWVILIGSIAVLVGLVCMYIGKLQGLSIKNVSAQKEADTKEDK